MTTVLAPPPPDLAEFDDEAEVPERQRMTVDEFLTLPLDDGVDRDLLFGEVWEEPMTVRTRLHSGGEGLITTRLQQQVWANGDRHRVCSGEAGVVLREEESAAGLDIVVIRREDYDESERRQTTYFECVPMMVVEVLSPTNVHEKIMLKIEACQSAGVPLIWLVDPRRRTVTAYRVGHKPVLFEGEETINADPAVPNFAMPTAKLFDE